MALRRWVWAFRGEHRGTFLTVNGRLGDNPAGAQCVNVPNGLYRSLGVPSIVGNAADWVGFSDSYREWLDTSSGLRLLVGDVAVFRPDIVGVNGHVDIVLDGSRRPYEGLDQNWPLGAPVVEVFHHEAALAGVVRLRGYHSR